MKQVINTEAIPIKTWLDEVDERTLEQAKNLANLPFAHKWVCLMPDAHCGYGMPIGGVVATKGVVIPNAVGVDIGCGMIAVRTPLLSKWVGGDQLKNILGKIRRVVPTGFKHHKEVQPEERMPPVTNLSDLIVNFAGSIVPKEYSSALKQLGTLGGGNHFIEIQKGSDGYIWIMIHSGSRNLGYKVAKHYNNLAKELNKKWFTGVLPKDDLAFLPLNSEEGKQYLVEMWYCVNFAYANRRLMMERVLDCFTELFVMMKIPGFWTPKKEDEINIAHNYATLESHFGENVMVHRKGATLAREGTIGIIPGCQGSKSYIVRGKGNPESFHSCSHGAGRLMSRTKAKEVLSLKDEQEKLDSKGILHSVRGKNNLDEAPGAYKDIQRVMELQADLVDVTVELEPLAVVKG